MELFFKFGILDMIKTREDMMREKYKLRKKNKKTIHNKSFNPYGIFKKEYPLFIDLILEEANLSGVYPFKDNHEVFNFMSKNITISTLNFTMLYTILDLFENSNMDIALREEISKIEEWKEYYAYWIADDLMANQDFGDTSKNLSTQALVSQSVEYVVEQGTIMYPDVLLQAIQSIKYEKEVTNLRACLSLFKDRINSENLKNLANEESGYLNEIGIGNNIFALLIYSH